MKLIWKGPSTAVEIYPETPGSADALPFPLFSGPVVVGSVIDLAEIDETHPQVASWLAFDLVEVGPSDAPAPAAPETPSRRLKITKIEEA